MPQLLTIDYDSPDSKFTQLFALNEGDVFKFTKNIESLFEQIQVKRPSLAPTLCTFDVLIAQPGSSYYTIQGENTFVVVKKEVGV